MESKTKRQKIRNTVLETLSYLFAAGTLVFLILVFDKDKNNLLWHVLGTILLVVLFAASRAVIHIYKETKQKKDILHKFFFQGLKVIIFILLLLGFLGVYMIFAESDCGPCAVYQAIGLGIVVLWACVFLSYFIWAVYYYNINLGIPDEEWKKIYLAKEQKEKGENYSTRDLELEPKYNPYQDQTFGLPAGTVRGMIAFTLLFGAIAMLVVSIGMKNQLDTSAMFWDQYEFFKTAFLMMIAFYFGSRSLQYLQNRNSGPIFPGQENKNNTQKGGETNTPSPSTGESATTDPKVDPMDPKSGKADVPEKDKKPKTISGTFDPMKPQA